MVWRRGQAYSQDLRDRVLAANGSAASVAARFGVSISYVVKARQRRDRRGEVSAGVQASHTPAKLLGHDDALHEQVLRVPDATLAELTVWAAAELGVSVSISAMSVRLRRLKLTLKKRRSLPLSSRAPMLPRPSDLSPDFPPVRSGVRGCRQGHPDGVSRFG
jgi:transposase